VSLYHENSNLKIVNVETCGDHLKHWNIEALKPSIHNFKRWKRFEFLKLETWNFETLKSKIGKKNPEILNLKTLNHR